MPEEYRFFAVHAVGEGGIPDASVSSYFRSPDSHYLGLPPGRAEFWDGTEWQVSNVQPFSRHMSDVLASGGAVREILDVRELPRA